MSNVEDDEFDEIDWTAVTLKWYGAKPPYENIDQLIREDCTRNLNGLAAVGELIFHTIQLTDSWDKDIVTAWGIEGDNTTLHCEFDANPIWQSVNLKDNDDSLS